MLERNSTRGSGSFREALWARTYALERRVVPRVASRTSLPAADLEDLWSELLMKAMRSPGEKGAIDADADSWSDADLVRWLRNALSHDVIDLHRTRTNKEGQSWIVDGSDPLDHLAEAMDQAAPSPEGALVDREALARNLRHVHELGGVDAARFVVADAAGASAADIGMTRARMRAVRDRLDLAGAELRARARAALWFLPDLVMRFFGSGGATPRVGAAAIAITATLAGGAGVATQIPHHPTETATKRAPSPKRAAATPGERPRQAAAPPSVQRVAEARRASTVASNRAAAARRAAARTRARSKARAARAARAAAARAAASAARDEFSLENQVAAAETAPAQTRSSSSTSSRSSGSASAAAVESEFQPGIH